METGLISENSYINNGSMGRHETFTPRYGWLKKGYDAATEAFDVFKDKNAIEYLGVGKNMVSSIRFWCQAFKVIKPIEKGKMEPTELGQIILSNKGWDPYIEDIATLWLFHWQLFIPRLEAVNWSLAFNYCNLLSFDIRQLTQVLRQSAQKYPRLFKMSENSFARDASCIIRMYNQEPPDKASEIECPFTQLELVRQAEESNFTTFNSTPKKSLPSLIFAAACFSYMDHYAKNQNTISLQKLAFDFNSPGVAFKLPESAVGDYLKEASDMINTISIEDYVGNLQLHVNEDPKKLYWEALNIYYANN